MKKILCPTDFSASSDKALAYAVYIAQHANAHLSLVHVLHLPIADTSDTALVAGELLSEQTRDAGEKLRAKCLFLEQQFGANQAGHFTCDYILKEALLTDTAAHLTKTEGYDLIVMGTTGRSSALEELLIGSNTEAVIEEVHCPVLSVPATASEPNIERIVYATDYSEEDSRALEEVVGVGSLFGADIHVVHVVKDEASEGKAKPQQFWNELQSTYADVPLYFQEITSKHRDEGLKRYYESIDGSLLAILRKEKGFLQELFSQSLAEQLTYQAEMPLLVLHSKNNL
ncbi:universal stress protein [Pontibacter sp. 172403-2]|uniref:universal stress protein n=1 Tax=Pontibacter rufus TaxID=2791028 RepID=UPI0018B00FE2|nr:universal stress protein [Pontibacter sp. 172403-2]MBF9252748.1 universal stress protein [Pontibacter sp. 172403-2]